MHDAEFVISRKQVIVGTGAVLTAAALGACAANGKQPAPVSVGAAPEASAVAGPPESGVAPLATTADVPVGSGVIVGDVVLTQPSAGVFKGFSAICTHAGCSVAKIANGTIDCPCHGSKFNLDGTVAKGPAARPLASKNISVLGDSIVLT